MLVSIALYSDSVYLKQSISAIILRLRNKENQLLIADELTEKTDEKKLTNKKHKMIVSILPEGLILKIFRKIIIKGKKATTLEIEPNDPIGIKSNGIERKKIHIAPVNKLICLFWSLKLSVIFISLFS